MDSRVVVSVDSELTPCMSRSDRVVKCRQIDLVWMCVCVCVQVSECECIYMDD